MSRGRKRSTNPNIPDHIDQEKIPKNCYWDNSYSGHWYTKFQNEAGRWRRRKIADRYALLSDLHRIMELENGVDKGVFAFLVSEYMASEAYKELSDSTKDDYLYCYKTIETYTTKLKKPLSQIPIHLWDDPLVQKFIDKMSKERGPSAAKHINSFIRRVFQWNLKRGNCTQNPAIKTELAKERKKQVYPTHKAYYALRNHAMKNATFGQKFKGSCPHYIWIIMELEYLCRLRGIECRTMTDKHVESEGVWAERTKGSRDNLATWNKRLKHAVKAAQKYRAEIYKKRNIATPMSPSDRPLVVNTFGETLKPRAYHSAWQRFITSAIKKGVIQKSERFSLHDLKRKGVTDTPGTRSEKLDASGHTEERMLDVYDKSRPKVNPSAD